MSAASELSKRIQKARCFVLKRAVRAVNVVEFVAMGDHFHGERRPG